MPNIGILKSRILLSNFGAVLEKTLDGPPDRISALGFYCLIFSKDVSQDNTSEKT